MTLVLWLLHFYILKKITKPKSIMIDIVLTLLPITTVERLGNIHFSWSDADPQLRDVLVPIDLCDQLIAP